jgi:SAM-dependent methyltransferase
MEAWPSYKRDRICRLVRELVPGESARVLEFGCGEGVFAAAVKGACPTLEVHGCDISATGIAKARHRWPVVEFHSLSPGSSGPQGTFDLVFSHHVLEHVQNLEDALRFTASLLKPNGKVMHVIPCGNEGSVEFRLSCAIKDGIGSHGLFALDDISHVRRLTTAQLDQACRRTGLVLRQAFYANQFWGGLDYLTGIYHGTILDWRRTFRGASRFASARLSCLLAILLLASLIRNGPGYVFATVGHRRAGWKRAVYLAAIPLAAAAYPASFLMSVTLEGARNLEWRFGKTRQNGSEAYLVFEKRCES